MMRCAYTHRGFSLAEILIAIGIGSVLLIVLFSLYSGYLGIYGQQTATLDTAGASAIVGNELKIYALQADRLLPSVTIGGTTYTTSSTTLVLELPSVDSSGNVLSGSYDYAIFSLGSTTLSRILSAQPASARTSSSKTLSTTVSSLVFSYDNATVSLVSRITMDLITQSTQSHSTSQYVSQTKAYVRNL